MELTIGPHIWRVVSDPEFDVLMAAEGHLGETLLHEVLHAAWSLTSLPETLGDREEEVVRALSPLLAQTVRVNG